jgi:nicotinate-nucleotide adenylyltransferase
MLALLRVTYPDDELYLLIGSDSLCDLLTWHDPVRVVAQARLAVMRRLGAEPNICALESALPGITARVDWVDAPWLDVSSTDIQRRVREGLSIRYLVPREVEHYIAERRLYRA